MRRVHEFVNGVRVFDDHLTAIQRDRYNRRNVHEADEEDIFVGIVRAIPATGCFLNIGAAVGYYPILAKILARDLTIHAVEPLPRHRTFFKENIALNGYGILLDQDDGSVLLRDIEEPRQLPDLCCSLAESS